MTKLTDVICRLAGDDLCVPYDDLDPVLDALGEAAAAGATLYVSVTFAKETVEKYSTNRIWMELQHCGDLFDFSPTVLEVEEHRIACAFTEKDALPENTDILELRIDAFLDFMLTHSPCDCLVLDANDARVLLDRGMMLNILQQAFRITVLPMPCPPFDPAQAADNTSIDKAILFAVQRHAGGVRKGSSIPAVTHPLEVMNILLALGADNDLVIAGILHDTVEDTETTPDELRQLFGEDVAALVAGHTEDKSKSWAVRKCRALARLETADRRLKLLVLADKLSNLRSIARDYEKSGDKAWDKFNAPAEMQQWYYHAVLEKLDEFSEFTNPAFSTWEELSRLYRDLFLEYWIDRNAGFVYHVVPDEKNIIRFCRETARYDEVDEIPENAELLTREDAENAEEVWLADWLEHNGMDEETYFKQMNE